LSEALDTVPAMGIAEFFHAGLFAAWIGYGVGLISLLILGELQLLRGRGRPVSGIRRLLAGPVRPEPRAGARCAGLAESGSEQLPVGRGQVHSALAAWYRVERRQTWQMAWVAVVALTPAFVALLTVQRTGLNRLVAVWVLLPALSLWGLGMLLLRLDTLAVRRRHSDELLAFAIAEALLACGARHPAGRSMVELTDALSRLNQALVHHHASVTYPLSPALRRRMRGQAAAMAVRLEDLLCAAMADDAHQPALTRAVVELREKHEKQLWMSLVDEEAGRAMEPLVAAQSGQWRRIAADTASLAVGVGVFWAAAWFGLGGEALAVLAPAVLLVMQVPNLVLGRRRAQDAPEPSGPRAAADQAPDAAEAAERPPAQRTGRPS